MPFFNSFFQAAKTLGATVFVLHGLKKPFTISETEYFRRFYLLAESAAQHGVSVCQENVVRFASEDPAFLARMAKALGKEFGVVFDIKQARRANRDYREYLELIGDHIQHVHLSDYNTEKDCIPPGEGEFDFSLFFGEMKSLGYKKAYMIELYRDSYENESQIADSYAYLKKLLR